MDPADTIIKRLGGTNVVAGITGVHRTRVSSWKRSRAKRGSDGVIPQRHISSLLDYARDKGIDLSADDFLVRGRTKVSSLAQGLEG